jgi:hypothetical protein
MESYKLGGRRPADVFQEDPKAVVQAAWEDFVETPYEGKAVFVSSISM